MNKYIVHFRHDTHARVRLLADCFAYDFAHDMDSGDYCFFTEKDGEVVTVLRVPREVVLYIECY